MEKTNNISYLLKAINNIHLNKNNIDMAEILRKKLLTIREMLQCAENAVKKMGGGGALDKGMENRIKYGLCRLEFLLNELSEGSKSRNNKNYFSSLAKEILNELPSFSNPEYEARNLLREVKLDGRRMREVQEIVDLLLSSDSMSSPVLIFPILGMLGSGKTTFVRLVCTHKRVQKHFPYVKWVNISGGRSGTEMLRQVVQELSYSNNGYSNLSADELASEFELRCSKLKYLLVLEDLSNDDGGKWFDLLNPLMCVLARCNPGSKVFVTSRSTSVENRVFVQLPMPKGMPHLLGQLRHYDSIAFFNSIAFRGIAEHDRNPHLTSIALEIANKCANNLQVIKIIASVLSFLPHPKWQHFNEVALGRHNPVEQILSVIDLMHQRLLNYYSLFPCDYQFGKEELNRLWEAQEQSIFSDPYEETTDINFEKLLGNEYLFECHKSDKSGSLVYYKGNNVLIHELAKHLASDEYRSFEKPAKEIDHLGIQHMSFFIDSTWEPPSWLYQAKHLKSLLFFPIKSDEFINVPDINLILGKLKALLALDLAAVNCRSCLNSIGELKYLRYLKLGVCFESLPECIINLKFLQTLDLRCSRVRELPEDFHKLCHLRHLYVGDRLTDLPPRFGELTELQSLDVFIVGQNNGLDALANIIYLAGKLKIHYRRGHEEHVLQEDTAFLKDKKLHELLLEWPSSNEESSAENYQKEDAMKSELLQPPPTLKSLTIKGWRGERFPQWAISNFSVLLSNLVSIHIVDCSRCKHLPSISKLGCLKSLQLWALSALEWIDICDTKSSETPYLQSLEHLSLADLPQLKGWFRMEEHDQETSGGPESTPMPQMPNLQSVEASNIHKDLLQKIFSVQASPVSSSSASTALSMLQSLCCLNLTNMSMPEPLPRGFECFTTLEEISLCWLYNMTILPESIGNFAHLHKLVIRYLPNLVDLPESLAGLSALKHVEIRYCPRLKHVPKYFSNLKSLQQLKIKECVNLEKRCQQPSGEDWPLIQHIPNVYLG